MKKNILSVCLVSFALLLTSCGSMRNLLTTEDDSVYFTSRDKITYNYQQEESENPEEIAQNQGREDDFAYSRRLRRFSSPSSNWRYYDPYYSNDLYYAMGTPSWNTWNNFGWNNFYSPYFGSPYGWGMSYNYCPMGMYNPWVGNYYGGMYSPYWNPYFNGGWGNPYFGGGWGNPYYGGAWGWGGSPYVGGNNGIQVNSPVWMPNRNNPSSLGVGTLANPTPRNTGRPSINNAPIKGTNNTYTTPRSNADFNNAPPKVYTPSPRVNTPAKGNEVTPRQTQSPSPRIYTAPSQGGEVKGNTPSTRPNTPATPRTAPAPRTESPSPRTAPSPRPAPSMPSFEGGGRSGGSSGSSGNSGGSSGGGGHRPR